MDLYLIRHAQARALGEDGVDRDEDRPLTEEGEAQARRIATGMHQRGMHVAGALLTSPLLRARQTAEAMLRHWPDLAPGIQECEELAPGVRPKKVARFLRGTGANSLGLVGHMPDLAEFLGWLIGNRKAHIDLAKAGVAYVTCDDVRKGDGTLQWLVTPEWFG